MMYAEFIQLAGYEVSYQTYVEIIEPMYMATNLSKENFIKCLDRKQFEVIPEKSPETLAIEKECRDGIKELNDGIKYNKERIDHLKSLLVTESDPHWIKEWKRQIKAYKEEIKMFKQRIAGYKFVLGV